MVILIFESWAKNTHVQIHSKPGKPGNMFQKNTLNKLQYKLQIQEPEFRQGLKRESV